MCKRTLLRAWNIRHPLASRAAADSHLIKDVLFYLLCFWSLVFGNAASSMVVWTTGLAEFYCRAGDSTRQPLLCAHTSNSHNSSFLFSLWRASPRPSGAVDFLDVQLPPGQLFQQGYRAAFISLEFKPFMPFLFAGSQTNYWKKSACHTMFH